MVLPQHLERVFVYFIIRYLGYLRWLLEKKENGCNNNCSRDIESATDIAK